MKTSSTVGKLVGAMAKVQGGVKRALKDKTNPHFNKTYADLASIDEACKEALNAEGVYVAHFHEEHTDGWNHMGVRLCLGDEWMESSWAVPVTKQDPQGFMAASTYMRRGMLAAMVGVVSEDDDGEAASGRDKAHGGSSIEVPGSKAGSGKVDVKPTNISKGPICCGKMMMESKFVDQKLGHKPWYCTSCRNTIAKDGVA